MTEQIKNKDSSRTTWFKFRLYYLQPTVRSWEGYLNVSGPSLPVKWG